MKDNQVQNESWLHTDNLANAGLSAKKTFTHSADQS